MPSSSSSSTVSPLLSLSQSVCCRQQRQRHYTAVAAFCMLLQFLQLSQRSCCLAASTTTTTQPTSLGVHMVRSPESAVAPKGDEVVFECELNLAPERLEWRFRHTSARATDAKHFDYLPAEDGYNITNDERTSKLRIFVSPETLGDYQCVAWFGSAAIASTSARLTLVSISIDNSNGYSRNAIRWSVAPKNCILIRCGTVSSNPAAVWSFYRNGEKVPQTEVLPSNGALILNSVSAKDSGNYTCSAMNAITGVEVKLPQRIDVRVDYTDRTPPYFLITPSNAVTSRPGETIVLECPGVGSPPPEAVWSSPNIIKISSNRTRMLPYGLQISDVIPEDQGSYVCRLDNGIAPALVHIIRFNVLERPKILRGPAATLTNEGDALELECSATGNPLPDIYWLLNGEDTSLDNETFHDGRRLVIKHVQKRHAGIVQCFAKNEVGEASEGSLLQVNPKQIRGESNSTPLGNVPIRSQYEHSGNKNKGKRKHMKAANMIPPSRPNVTRLSDDAVMLRWFVPKNDGLPIQFFKVQYRMLGDTAHKIPRENWQTTNEDIPYGKRDRNFEGVKNFTSSVSGLKADRYYRFRIIAVYSNNDNKEGNTSAKFFLQRGSALGPSKASLPAPELARVEAISETAVMLHWTLPANPANTADGFYAYYRPASSAGEYLKATVDGMQTRKFKIDMLEPGTAYEFKLQSFNALAASEFSAILQGKTKKIATTPSPIAPSSVPTTDPNEEDNSIYPVVAGATGGGLLLLFAAIVACVCITRHKNSHREDEDKPQLDHIQADYVTPSVLGGVPNHHKSSGGHRLNGVMPRMNITPNPMAQEADKNRNVMELRFMPNTTINSTTTSSSSTNNATEQTINNVSDEHLNEDETDSQHHHHQAQRSSSSCETLEASDGISTSVIVDSNSPLSKPLPPLPTKLSSIASAAATVKMNHTIPTNSKQQSQAITATSTSYQPSAAPSSNQAPTTNYNIKSNTHTSYNSQGPHIGSQSSHQGGLHHAQPYHQTPPPGTPTMLHKRGGGVGGIGDYHHPSSQHQHPPPVPPHQNNNHQSHQTHHNHHQQHHASPPHHATYQQPPSPVNPSMDQHRRTLERSARNLSHYPGPVSAATSHDSAMNIDGLPTRIPSLRRTRRTSGNANNNNGGVGIPIVPGSPRVQRSPMPARAMIKRNRLGSHNDNMSSGSLNSIEV